MAKKKKIPRDSVVLEFKTDLGHFLHVNPAKKPNEAGYVELKKGVVGAARFKKQVALNYLKENGLEGELQLIATRLVHSVLAARKVKLWAEKMG